jgi:hydroxyacylglutathione hydrolase
LPVLEAVVAYAPQFGIRYEPSPIPDTFLGETGTVSFGNTTLSLIYAPGHSPAHLCFHDEDANLVIGGDVLFRGSIGRTDLPGGDFKTLIDNIEQKLLTLPDSCTIYPGHGPETTIGFEKLHNPFLT